MFNYLKNIGDGSIAKETPDCSVVPMKGPHAQDKVQLISTTDFFYPAVEDPYLQGRIACCNTLSDVYAMGIDRIDHVLMVLGVSLKMTEDERQIVTEQMIKGFDDCCKEAETLVTGGQSIMNPWPIIGGVANVVCHESEYLRINRAEPGDVLVLTKPLGTQHAVNLNQWLIENRPRWTDQASKIFTPEQAKNTYYQSVESMATLNRNAASLLKKYDCRSSTDVTGFGIKGHAENLVEVQTKAVNFEIEALPVFQGVHRINQEIFNYKLLDGFAAETSGGLLIALPA